MQFSYLQKFFPKIEKNDLPGRSAQALLAPEFRKALLEQKLEFPDARKAGVLMLLYPDYKNEVKFVLILRKSYKGVHSNQIAFPGGKLEDSDQTIVDTAIRETEEEVGVKRQSIRVIKPLTPLYIPPSNFMVYPALAYTDSTPVLKKQADEVEKIIEVDLEYFLKQIDISKKNINASYAKEKLVLCFEIQGYIVWGATAMMLSELKVMINSVLKTE